MTRLCSSSDEYGPNMQHKLKIIRSSDEYGPNMQHKLKIRWQFTMMVTMMVRNWLSRLIGRLNGANSSLILVNLVPHSALPSFWPLHFCCCPPSSAPCSLFFLSFLFLKPAACPPRGYFVAHFGALLPSGGSVRPFPYPILFFMYGFAISWG